MDKNMGKVAAIIGLTASLIAIFTFLTGIVSVKDILGTPDNISQLQAIDSNSHPASSTITFINKVNQDLTVGDYGSVPALSQSRFELDTGPHSIPISSWAGVTWLEFEVHEDLVVECSEPSLFGSIALVIPRLLGLVESNVLPRCRPR